MGWIPESIWTPDLISMSKLQPSPHDFYDVFSIMSVAAWNTQKFQLGTSVTEPFRRHPAVLAQIFLTQDHISKGRTILGIGTGEGENVIPYGIKWDKPVTRLEEAIKIIRLLWDSDDKVNFDGTEKVKLYQFEKSKSHYAAGFENSYPSWSLDDTMIYFSYFGESYIMNEDGSNPRPREIEKKKKRGFTSPDRKKELFSDSTGIYTLTLSDSSINCLLKINDLLNY